MGTRLFNATHSAKLGDFLTLRGQEGWDWSDFADATSTAGYDNDGSTGPELFDNGLGLAFSAVRYDKDAKVFFAFVTCDDGEEFVAWQFGKDEDDALRRLAESFAEAEAE